MEAIAVAVLSFIFLNLVEGNGELQSFDSAVAQSVDKLTAVLEGKCNGKKSYISNLGYILI